MKWKDHQRLIRVATGEHHVPLGTYNGLLEGSIYPDKTNTWLKSRGKAMKPHHHINTGKIIKLIWRARRNWLNNNENDAGFQLGQALHFIHDGYVSKGILGLYHDSNEEKLNTIPINKNILYSGINDSRSDPIYIENLIHLIKPQNPEQALDNATYVTASIIKAVFNSKTVPIELEEQFCTARLKHKKYVNAAIGTGIIIFVLGAALNSMQLIIFAPVLGFVITKMDSEYFLLKKKSNWFKME